MPFPTGGPLELGPKHIGITTLMFQGHVRSTITRPFDLPYAISYGGSLEPSLYLQPFLRYLAPKTKSDMSLSTCSE